MSSKQMRVSCAVYDEIIRLSDTFGIDRQTIINSSIALIKQILESQTDSIEIIDYNGIKKTISTPIVVKKK